MSDSLNQYLEIYGLRIVHDGSVALIQFLVSEGKWVTVERIEEGTYTRTVGGNLLKTVIAAAALKGDDPVLQAGKRLAMAGAPIAEMEKDQPLFKLLHGKDPIGRLVADHLINLNMEIKRVATALYEKEREANEVRSDLHLLRSDLRLLRTKRKQLHVRLQELLPDFEEKEMAE